MKVALTSDLHYGYASNSTNKIIKMLKNLQKEEVDVLIVAGDSATVAQYQFKRCMETLREYLDMPIYYVRGNHDIWNGFHKKDKSHNLKSLDQIYNYHDKICDPINIIHLDKGPIQLDSGRVELYGFDGWYGSNTPETNDFKWIPTEYKNQPSNVYLANKTWQDGLCL
jgi:DNA repair exonuclease SbcCD nuclease subunit